MRGSTRFLSRHCSLYRVLQVQPSGRNTGLRRACEDLAYAACPKGVEAPFGQAPGFRQQRRELLCLVCRLAVACRRRAYGCNRSGCCCQRCKLPRDVPARLTSSGARRLGPAFVLRAVRRNLSWHHNSSEHLRAKPSPAVSSNPVAGAGPCRMGWHRKPAVFSWSLSQRLQLQRGSLVTDFDESGRILANIGDRCA